MLTTRTTSTPDSKSGVKFKIGVLPTDVQREAGVSSSTTTVRCRLAFQYVDQFFREMLGWSYLDGTLGSAGARLRRVLPEPMRYRGNGQNPYQYALTAKNIENIYGKNGTSTSENEDQDSTWGWPQFESSVVDVNFGAPLYKILEDDQVTYEHERYCLFRSVGVSENQAMPGGAFKFVTDQTPIPDTGIKTGRAVDLTVKWLDVPAINFTKIAGLANKVNAAAWTLDGKTYPAETALFKTWSYDPKVNANGLLTNDVTFFFGIRQDLDYTGGQRTWNKFWKKDGSTELVTLDGTPGGQRVFLSGDLNGIFSMS